MKVLVTPPIFLFFFLANIHIISAQSKQEFNLKMIEAAKNDQADSVKFWIEKGANVNYLDQSNMSALHYAIYNREYLKRCAKEDLNSDDEKLWIWAVLSPNYYKGGIGTCQVLIKMGININSNKCARTTPLMLACEKGDLRLCKLLLDNGASMKLLDDEGNDAISRARAQGYKRVMSFLLDQHSYSETQTYYEILLGMDSLILMNNFTKALEFGELALLKASNELNGDHRDIEMIKKRLIVINEQLRKFENAQLVQKDIIKGDLTETKEKVSGMIQFPGYYDMLSNMAKFAMSDGEYLRAEIIINGLIQYSKKFEIKKSENLIYLYWLSNIYINLEEFAKAEKILNELLKENIENEQYKKELTTAIYLGLSQINNAIGNIKASKQYAERALNELDSDEKANRSIALGLIGESYFNENNYERALKYLKESSSISESLKDSYFLIYSGSKNNLGYYYLNNNELHNAEIIFEGLKIEYESKNLYNQNYCGCLENLAKISIQQNDFLKAKYYSETAQKINNEKNNGRLSDLSLLASIQYSLNNYKEADSLYELSSKWIVNSLKEKFLYLSENDRNFFSQAKNKSIDEFQSFSLNYYPINQEISRFLYDNELFRKGMLLNASQQVRDAINNSGDSALIDTWNQLKDIRMRINFLLAQPKEKLLEIADLEEGANQMDKLLTQKSQAFRQLNSEQQIRWQDIQSKLKNSEAVIEFSSFRYYNKHWTDSTMYCALILKKGMEYPVTIPLFEQKQLDSLLFDGRVGANNLYASRGITSTYVPQLPNGRKLYNLIWKPLEKDLRDVKTVYYSPSGSLHQIAFAALPIDSTAYLCDRYNLVQLSSSRQLATSTWQAKSEPISSIALFGGIKYDLDSLEIGELKKSFQITALAKRFIPDSSLHVKQYHFLKGTKIEVESISTALQAKNIKTLLYTGINGNKGAFKSLSNQNISVLHIATHGFFDPYEKEKPQDLDRMMLVDVQKFRYVPNPLRRSGLILAGGNRTWKGEEPIAGLEDGILTALEISEMNLQNTELVVLSACETGRGDIKGGEGVFGLQRAFKLAGVKTIIMSLWNVDDKATSELMQLFYSKWINGMDKRESFRTAQQEIKKKYNEPYFWAAFVMLD